MHRVEPEAVEVVLLQPVEGVVDEILSYVLAALAVKVDRCSPRRVVPVGEELRGVERKVVSFGTEVVVDHVEEGHEASGVGVLHEVLEFIRGPVGAFRGERQYAVVAPVTTTRELGERHQLDSRDAKLDKVVELFLDTGEGSFGGKGADVQLVQDDLLPGASLPVLVPPSERSGIHDLARAVHAVGLASGGRVWNLLSAVDAETVARACPRFDGQR